MKIHILTIISATLLACEPAPAPVTSQADGAATEADGTASFRMGNGEIREDMIRMLDEANIQYRLGEDGEIIYRLADGAAIDRIGNEAISEYITRN